MTAVPHGRRPSVRTLRMHSFTGDFKGAAELAALIPGARWERIPDPETSRPVHVRFSVLPLGGEISPRSRLLGEIERDGERLGVYGTYLGVVSEEN
ncbi:hypothetical protein OG884_14595 [Streptosporangium sp. NBC_01755]|uniref:hypothetical protein n=1 Tax=unclassified Streptosporangium TaxID=2632669 RepID=UPI002DDC8B76|nr:MULTISPECIES: hypothetical protein [unclassified Streptosporangium]WSA25542.1 hypothetical protein OIE13_32280 [Streptosporangium sp. NBC_01810]WSD03070.1 hypothetical protein OG884_14595 [Streptosporangium sp. NBC_01755]